MKNKTEEKENKTRRGRKSLEEKRRIEEELHQQNEKLKYQKYTEFAFNRGGAENKEITINSSSGYNEARIKHMIWRLIKQY